MKLIVILILFIPTQLISQNLVRNPSFEKVENCIDKASAFDSNVVKWSTPTSGTSDLFNSCSNGENGVPNNFIGHQLSKFGKNYGGFYLYTKDNYREYIQGYFKSPLEKGKKYNVSFYISLAEKSDFSLKKIDFILTKNRILTFIRTELSQNQIPLITSSFSINKIESKHFYDDTKNWTLLSKVITAKGGENYVTIGNIQKNSSTKKRRISKGKNYKMSYYYIDMISVELLEEPLKNQIKKALPQEINVVKVTKTAKTNIIELDKSYVIKNITFSFNSIVLSKLAKTELNIIYEYLNLNKNTKITIIGHTDDVGSNDNNKTLSENRANSVAEYLTKLGINKKRIKIVGYGKTKPLSTNRTNEGRNKNRRVEFKITKNKNL